MRTAPVTDPANLSLPDERSISIAVIALTIKKYTYMVDCELSPSHMPTKLITTNEMMYVPQANQRYCHRQEYLMQHCNSSSSDAFL